MITKRTSMKKKGAMEMSVGTIVTIVLLMTVLILGLIMIRTIFKSSTENIGAIDTAVKNEINKLFSEDSTRKAVIYPATRQISVKKGQDGGFGFSIRNTDSTAGVFSYTVNVVQIPSSCTITENQAESLIILGGSGNNINIPSGDVLADPILVKFSIPDSASLCDIRYGVDIKKDGEQYLPTISVDLQITSQ